MIFGLLLMLMVMVAAVIGVMLLWPADPTATARSRRRFSTGVVLCIATAVLLTANAMSLWTADVCATCA